MTRALRAKANDAPGVAQAIPARWPSGPLGETQMRRWAGASRRRAPPSATSPLGAGRQQATTALGAEGSRCSAHA
eukprot:588860-Alexandrium_andersonii.AAC.1